MDSSNRHTNDSEQLSISYDRLTQENLKWVILKESCNMKCEYVVYATI